MEEATLVCAGSEDVDVLDKVVEYADNDDGTEVEEEKVATFMLIVEVGLDEICIDDTMPAAITDDVEGDKL